MYRHRELWVGIFLFAILAGCSKDKELNVQGAYSPIIENLSADKEPAVRGDVNTLTAQVLNVRGLPLQFHWTAGAGTLTDSTSATVHWTAPDSIGSYPVTVAVTAHDDVNNVDFYQTRTFQVYVDNEFTRWTRSAAVQFDVAPPVENRIYYSEIRNSLTGESDVWGVTGALGAPQQITNGYFNATQPTVDSDGSQVAFAGRVTGTEGGPSIWTVPSTGGDPATATEVVPFGPNGNHLLGSPRFAPTGPNLLFTSDTLSFAFNRPKPWKRDVSDFSSPPISISNTDPQAFENTNINAAYPYASWRGTGDSIVCESYTNYTFPGQTSRGLFKFNAAGSAPVNPDPVPVWLNDPTAAEPDWSPDGSHIIFTRRAPGRTDRDIWIINAGSSDPATAVRVTFGPADDSHPRFSSDGSKIFFVSNRADRYGLNGVYETERRGTNIWSVGRFDQP